MLNVVSMLQHIYNVDEEELTMRNSRHAKNVNKSRCRTLPSIYFDWNDLRNIESLENALYEHKAHAVVDIFFVNKLISNAFVKWNGISK